MGVPTSTGQTVAPVFDSQKISFAKGKKLYWWAFLSAITLFLIGVFFSVVGESCKSINLSTPCGPFAGFAAAIGVMGAILLPVCLIRGAYLVLKSKNRSWAWILLIIIIPIPILGWLGVFLLPEKPLHSEQREL